MERMQKGNAVTKKKRKMLPGVSRARRSKTGKNRGMLILISDQEKLQIERAAAREGGSMSRFMVERALKSSRSSTRAISRGCW